MLEYHQAIRSEESRAAPPNRANPVASGSGSAQAQHTGLSRLKNLPTTVRRSTSFTTDFNRPTPASISSQASFLPLTQLTTAATAPIPVDPALIAAQQLADDKEAVRQEIRRYKAEGLVSDREFEVYGLTGYWQVSNIDLSALILH
jgi:hypothetical protein